MSIDSKSLIGTTFADRYEITGRVGAGGMGTVFRAKHLAMDREVAIKVLNPHLVADEASRKRFVREMKATSSIDSPYTVSVFDFGTTEHGDAYLVMEFLEGRTLKNILRKEGPLDIDRLMNIAKHVCAALGAAHDEGIIHRDIKPENIIMLETFDGSEWTKVLDFGIAQVGAPDPELDEPIEHDSDHLTATGTVLGTPTYMAPERARGQNFDHRSDLYALGVLMFVMATGKPPYESTEPMSLLFKHITDPIPRLSDKAERSYPEWLEPLIHVLMAKDADDRPATAADFMKMIDAALATGEMPMLATRERPNPNAETLALPAAGKATQDVTANVNPKGDGGRTFGVTGVIIFVLLALTLGVLLFEQNQAEHPPPPVEGATWQKPPPKRAVAETESAPQEESTPLEDQVDSNALSRRLSAVLFTDMVGYTKLSSLDEDDFKARMDAHDDALKAAFKAHEGRIVKPLGDGFMVEFTSAIAATRAALMAQDALAKSNLDVKPELHLRVRMGIHSGEVMARGSDLLGETVNIASQLRRIAEPNTVAITDAVQVHLGSKLSAPSRALGELKLKGREAPVAVSLLANAEDMLQPTVPSKEAAEAVDPGFADALKAIDRSLKRNPAAALKRARALLETHPKSGEVMLRMAQGRLAVKQTGRALKDLELCRATAPNFPPCLLELAKVKKRAGRAKESQALYQELVDKFPGTDEAAQAAERLR